MSKAEQYKALKLTAFNIASTIRALNSLSLHEWEKALRGDYGTYFSPKGNPTVEQRSAVFICHEAYYLEPCLIRKICYGRSDLLGLLMEHNQSHHSVTGIQLINGVLYTKDNDGYELNIVYDDLDLLENIYGDE